MSYVKKNWRKISLILILALLVSMIPILSMGNDAVSPGDLTENQGINVELFNYGKGINGKIDVTKNGKTLKNSEIKDREISFWDTAGNVVDNSTASKNYGNGWSDGDKDINMKPDYFSKNLENGYPVITSSEVNTSFLFAPGDINVTDKDSKDKYAKRYVADTNYTKKHLEVNSVSGLFEKNSDGYYEYDSNKNHAYYDESAKEFIRKNYIMKPGYNKNAGYGNFLPFNLPTDEKASGTTKYTLANRKAADDKRNPAYTQAEKALYTTDLWFGMTVDFNFFQPMDGKISKGDSKEAMEFSFRGDDDVLVYVDGVRLLDIGMVHSAQAGSINFATGKITSKNDDKSNITTIRAKYIAAFNEMSRASKDGYTDPIKYWASKGITFNKDTYSDYSNHEFKFFYLERGGSLSNCKMKFNMPVVEDPYPLSVEKTLSGHELKDVDKNADYSFKLYTASGDTSPVKMSEAGNVGYWVYEGDKLVEPKEIKYTDENGIFKLKAGQKAVFNEYAYGDKKTEDAFSNNVSYYRVEEVDVDADKYSKITATNNYNDGEKCVTTKNKATSLSTMSNDESLKASKATYFKARSSVVFDNEYYNPRNLIITKSVDQVNDATPNADDEFEFELVIGDIQYGGKYTLYENDSDLKGTSKTADKGIIKLKDKQRAEIANLAPGDEVKVTENESKLPAFYTIDGDDTTKTATIGANADTTISFTNNYDRDLGTVSAIKLSDPASGTKVYENDEITYTVNVTNNSKTTTAEGVVVKDYIPANTEFVEFVDDAGTRGAIDTDDEYVAWYIGDMKPEGKASVKFKVKVNTDDFVQIENVALYEETKKVEDDVDFDANPKEKTNVVRHPTDEANPLVTIVKKNTPDKDTYVNAGDPIVYDITIKNEGNRDLSNIVISDVVPDFTKFKEVNDINAISKSGTYDSSSKEVTWEVGDLKKGQEVQVQFTVTVDSDVPGSTMIKNIAYVSANYTDKGIPSDPVYNYTPAVEPELIIVEPAPPVVAGEVGTPEVPQQKVLGDEAKTGDTSTAMPYLLAMMLATLAIFAVIFVRMNRREQE